MDTAGWKSGRTEISLRHLLNHLRLFADTPKGAKANAVLYTLVESARANKLDVYEYLKYLLTELPNSSYLGHPELLDQYLPWSGSLPEVCEFTRRHLLNHLPIYDRVLSKGLKTLKQPENLVEFNGRALWAWVEETSALATTNEKLTQALGYSKTRGNTWRPSWKTVAYQSPITYVKQTSNHSQPQGGLGSLPIPRRGAKANAVFYTLIESARANKLDVYEYLKYLLTELPNSNYLEHPDLLNQYLPWSGSLPEVCRLEHRYKKCFHK